MFWVHDGNVTVFHSRRCHVALLCRYRSMIDTRRYAAWPDLRSRSRSRRSESCENGNISKSICSTVILYQTTNGELWYSRQFYLNFNRTSFWYSSSFGVKSYCVPHLAKANSLPFTRSRPAVQYGAYFFYIAWVSAKSKADYKLVLAISTAPNYLTAWCVQAFALLQCPIDFPLSKCSAV